MRRLDEWDYFHRMQSKLFLDPFLEICFREYFFRMTRQRFRVCPKYVLVQKIKVFEVNQYCQNN